VSGCVPTSYVLQAGLQPGASNIGAFPIAVHLTQFAVNAPPGTYFVRVAAANVFGTSAPSDEVAVTVTGGCTSPPNAPEGLSGGVSGTLVSLNWNASTGGCAATGYFVQAGRAPGSSDVGSIPVGLQTRVSAPAPAATYFVRVVAVNAFGTSAPSNELTLTVAAPTPTLWSVTQRFVSVTGPDNCWVRQQRARLTGVVFAGLEMAITRSGGSITVDGYGFWAGTVNGKEFSASEALEGGGTTCDGTSFLQRPGVSNLSGRFSDDDQRFSATEVNSYFLTTGELVTYVWDWQATRQN
jgi:hypothetical protein